MHRLRKKRILALVTGLCLMIALPFLAWAGISLSSKSSSLVYTLTGWICTLLTVALEPLIVGGIVGAWIRGGSKHPWLRASGFGVILWWAFLLASIISTFVWIRFQLPPPDSAASNGSGPRPGYGLGLLGGFVLIYGAAYAAVGLPFILLGAALTFPRRAVEVNETHSANREYR